MGVLGLTLSLLVGFATGVGVVVSSSVSDILLFD